MLVSSGTGPLLTLLLHHSLVVGIAVGAVAVAVSLLSLNVVIIHEVDGHFSLGSPLPALALLLLLLHQVLLSLPGLLAGLGLGVDDIFINKGIIELGGVHSMVIGEEVVNGVASIGLVLFTDINFLKFSTGHFLGGSHALESRFHIFVVVQLGSSKNS